MSLTQHNLVPLLLATVSTFKILIHLNLYAFVSELESESDCLAIAQQLTATNKTLHYFSIYPFDYPGDTAILVAEVWGR